MESFMTVCQLYVSDERQGKLEEHSRKQKEKWDDRNIIDGEWVEIEEVEKIDGY